MLVPASQDDAEIKDMVDAADAYTTTCNTWIANMKGLTAAKKNLLGEKWELAFEVELDLHGASLS